MDGGLTMRMRLKTGARLLASKPDKLYNRGIDLLVQRWQQTIECDAIYFDE